MTTVELAKWHEDATPPTTVHSVLFGELVKLAQPHVKRFHSDLYHDAQWIERHVTGPLTFYFGVGEYGTNIGTDQELVGYLHADGGLYEVTVTHEEGVWAAEVSCVR